jgi:hypothetical protein
MNHLLRCFPDLAQLNDDSFGSGSRLPGFQSGAKYYPRSKLSPGFLYFLNEPSILLGCIPNCIATIQLSEDLTDDVAAMA